MKRRIIACLLVATMVAGSLVGCGKKEKSSKKTNGSLVIASGNFNQEFSPFFSDTSYDNNIVDLTQVALFGLDREGSLIKNGIEGEQ